MTRGGGGEGVDGGSPCHMSIIRNGNVALSNLRPRVSKQINSCMGLTLNSDRVKSEFLNGLSAKFTKLILKKLTLPQGVG